MDPPAPGRRGVIRAAYAPPRASEWRKSMTPAPAHPIGRWRLPDQIDVRLAAGGQGKLHDYAKRRGHTALLIGGPGTSQQSLSDLRRDIEPLTDGHIIEGIVAIAANPGVAGVDAYLEPAAAALLGVGDMVLLVIRADGHVGLRAERRHAGTFSAYVALLRASPGAAP